MTSPDPMGPVYIGAREIYDQVVRVDSSVHRVSDQITDLALDVKDHESRLRLLEKARWPIPALAILISMASLALTFVPHP
jgi:hypothetical protein